MRIFIGVKKVAQEISQLMLLYLKKYWIIPLKSSFFFPLYVTFLYFSGCLQQYIGANVQAENPKEVRLGALRRYLRKFFTEAARQGKRGHSTTKKGENKSN